MEKSQIDRDQVREEKDKKYLDSLIEVLKVDKKELESLVKMAMDRKIPVIESKYITQPFYKIELYIPEFKKQLCQKNNLKKKLRKN